MKVSYNWLREFVSDIPSLEKTVNILTNTGLEVSGVEDFESVPGGLEGMIIGEVVEKWQHPNADRLCLTKVDVGSGENLQIVCGAPNVSEGQKVVVAQVGAKLYPSEGEPFKIKKGKIRGEESHGMICAEDEIGLGTSHDGIMVLDHKANVGTPASEYFQIKKDHIIEIDLTPNRSDAISHIGVARDLQAFLNNEDDKLQQDSIQIPNVKEIIPEKKSVGIEVEIADSKECLRYAGAVVSGIKVGESPEWLKNRLTSLGLGSINNVVDITNLVMMESGQPLHAFDVSQITGNKIVVRNAAEGTKFVTLDEKERSLSSTDMMICNAEKEMCIAGVFGGLTSGVSDETESVFIESAIFDPVKIRKTARFHGLNTDASYRFERGVDPEMVIYALKRSAQLLVEIAGGKITSEVVDVYPNQIQDHIVDFSLPSAMTLIGNDVPVDKIRNILNSLDIQITKEEKDNWQLQVPAYRHDVTRQADVVEEILRIYGYNRISQPEQFYVSFSFADKIRSEDAVNKIADTLTAMNFQEIINNSLTSSKYYGMNGDLDKEVISILNPLSAELDVLRKELIFSGLETLQANFNQRIKSMKFFEFGKTYAKPNSGFEEDSWLALWMIGERQKANWKYLSESIDFFDLKATVEKILRLSGGLFDEVSSSEIVEEGYLSYGLNYTKGKNSVAKIGLIDKPLTKKFDLEGDVFYAQLNWNMMLEQVSINSSKKFKEIIKYPGMRRDLSLLVASNTSFTNIRESIEGIKNKWLRDIDLFDVYEGDKLPEGKKSYAISLFFQDADKTLTDQAVDKLMDKIINQVKKELQAELR